MDVPVQQLCLKIYEALKTPLSDKLATALKAGDGMTIANAKVNPHLYCGPFSFAVDYAAVELCRKAPTLPGVNIDREAVARESFWECERRNYHTNQMILGWIHNSLYLPPHAADFISRVKRRIKSWIGDGPGEYHCHGGFGPGVTFRNRGKRILAADKLENTPCMTAECHSDVGILVDFHLSAWHNARDPLEIVRGNRFTTVPKDSLKDRGICIEPSVNLFYQKALGAVLRRRLKAVGLDLETGQDRNGALALVGSVKGTLATVDLSSASDTVSSALVRLLLPPKWYEQLDNTRSHYTLISGHWTLLEKFSSMGNGFTFELETCIFAAIATECSVNMGETPVIGTNVSAYGDDIVVATSVYEHLLKVLTWLGFLPNARKCFGSGSFRESCGHDYWGGLRVEPLRIDSDPDNFQFWISTANRLRNLFIGLRIWGTPPSLRAWRHCIDQIPKRHRIFGPERLGDAVVHDDERSWVVRDGEKFRGGRSVPGTKWMLVNKTTTVPVPWTHWLESTQLAIRVHAPGDYSRGHTGRGCIVTHQLGWVSVS